MHLLKLYSLKVWPHRAGIPWLEQLRGICLIPVRSSTTRLLLVAQPLTELGQTCNVALIFLVYSGFERSLTFLFSLQNMDHGRAWGYLTFKGKTEEEVKEIDKAMYHDWRMVPKHEEEAFKKFTPVPEETVRFLPYPPLLRAMILAQWQKEGKPIMEEPIIDLETVLASPQEQAKKKATGTPV
ncbi:PREDICTED: 28S ribosomal protein S34, mitochondrial [Corvus brachyrhynchos]|uniref:28S ribosomal protein S34, mitochondrial n=1 Tax=Corvus brachyrhynchos TaxID=85066 RepID=UPI0008163380|nr:PREDICTED: 28S ribosomal protein S34, mitochondrial [Corvus brachyrhynchos]